MGEADDAVTWVRIMRERYQWGTVSPSQMVEADAIGVDGREGVQYLYEWLFFKGLLEYRCRKDKPLG
jgi:hypothetical protein